RPRSSFRCSAASIGAVSSAAAQHSARCDTPAPMRYSALLVVALSSRRRLSRIASSIAASPLERHPSAHASQSVAYLLFNRDPVVDAADLGVQRGLAVSALEEYPSQSQQLVRGVSSLP